MGYWIKGQKPHECDLPKKVKTENEGDIWVCSCRRAYRVIRYKDAFDDYLSFRLEPYRVEQR